MDAVKFAALRSGDYQSLSARTGSSPVEGDKRQPDYGCDLGPQEDKHVGAHTQRWRAGQRVAQDRHGKGDGGYSPDKRRFGPSGTNKGDQPYRECATAE